MASVQSVSNEELYNRWAKVYDTDGNILQGIDDLLLPPLLSQAPDLFSSSPITITELGCGTGRNTSKLLLPPISTSATTVKTINALDLSPSMLSLAQQRCEATLASLTTTTTTSTSTKPPTLNFHIYDALNPALSPLLFTQEKADLLLATLVLEHLPLSTFFSNASSLLKPEGVLVLTNMHANMGRISQAGFKDPETGDKVRGTSYVYEISEVVSEGEKWGFEVMGKVGEREVRDEDVGEREGKMLGPRGKKWIGVKVWFGCVMRFHRGDGL